MRLEISDIIVSIESTELRKTIPEGEDILYSALFNASTLHGNKHHSWKSHVLITPKGVALQLPDFLKRKSPIQNMYFPWYHIGLGTNCLVLNYYSVIEYKIMKLNDLETKQAFKARGVEFYYKFRDFELESRTKYLEKLKNNPNTKKKELKEAEKAVSSSLKFRNTIDAKQEKIRQKQEKKNS